MANMNIAESYLPIPGERWTVLRKARVLAAIDDDVLSVAQAGLRYELSADEIASWRRLYARHGMIGLRTTRTQEYRGKQFD